MESGNGGASSEGFLIPVSESSDVFQSKILAPLQSAYLYEESKQFFRYKSAVLVKNPDLENKYEAFRAGKRNAGYSEDDLKETYCFLLFEDGSKANALGEMGVISGNSTCTTLGDPTKGVYISMYSDCLDLNRWYHGKSGYIAIIKLTKGKVRKVAENYTQNFTEPTVGFDCHVSEQLPSVSAKTSSFLAFERTQFYIYELLQDGSSGTSQSPSAACPFAIVSFSYMDTKASPVPQQRSEVKKQVRHYLPWRGKLQLESQCYHIDLRSTAVGLIPVQLPSVITVNQAISMSVLRNILPRAVFETCYDEEVFLEGFYCDLCEFGPSGTNEASSFALLLSEIKEKDLAFCIPLNDGGFLILMHSSHFLRYDDVESASAEVMQGLFVFPDSRVVRKDIKFGEKNSALSSQIQLVLPVLSYAEGEAEKTPMDPKDDLCEVLAHHMQSYATLINPGFSSSPFRPSRELSIFPDQYDVAEAYKHLYSSPEWNNGTWQTFKSYLSKPASFQIPIAKVSQILASGQEERREDLDDDVYICVSSPEEAPSSPVCMEAEDPISDEQSLGNIETSMDIGLPSAELQIAPTPVSQSAVEDNVQSKNITKDDLKCTPPTEQPNKPDDPRAEDPLTPPTSEDLPAELIVSITSAEQSVPDEVSAAKHTDFHFSGLSTMVKLPAAEVKSVIESDKAKQCLDFSVVTKHQTRTKRRRRRRRCSLARKKISKTSVKTQSLKIAISSVEVEHLSLKTEEHNEDAILPQLRNSLKPKWKKLHRRKRRFGKLSSKKRKLRPAAVDSTKARKKKSDAVLESSESTIFLGVEALPLRKKMERWDLKPVISECGRILFPFGSGDQVKSMPCTKMDECLERLSHEVPVTFPDPVITNKQLGTALETAIDETTATNSINGEDPQLDLGDIILTPPDDDGGGVPLTSNFCTAFRRNYDTNGLSKTDETGSPVSLSAKGELLLSKLKSVLSRRKRKLDLTIKEQKRENADQESRSCFKKTKVDPETPKDSNATPQSVNVSKMPSVDPLFAYYLGLTPKENLENVQNTKELNTLKRRGSTEKDEHTSLDKQPQIIQRPLSIFSRRRRIKTLKRHPFISAENVKKKCTTFQVPPLSGSTRLLNHHHTMYDNGDKILHSSVNMEDISEHNITSEYVKKRKFKCFRSFVIKEKSIQVTRKWEENYNFNLDSRFTSDPKDKVVIRALHGPWNFTLQDTIEEVRLIFHMWIGLFYSRSTARFFQVDPTFMPPRLEESGSVEMASGTLPGPTRPEIASAVALSSQTETPDPVVSKTLDLRKKVNTVSVPESGILDLSVKSFNAKPVPSEQQLNKKATSVSSEPLKTQSALKPAADLQEKETFQLHKAIEHFKDISSEVKDDKDIKIKTEHKALCYDHLETPSSKSDGTLCQREEINTVHIEPEPDGATFGTEPMFHGCSKEISITKVGIESGTATLKSLPQEDALCSPTSVTDKGVNSNIDDSNVMHTSVFDDLEIKAKESCKMGNSPCQDGNRDPCLDMTKTSDESVNKESDIVYNGSVVNEKLLNEKSGTSHDETDNLEGNMDCRAGLTSKEVKSVDNFSKKDDVNEKSWESTSACKEENVDKTLLEPRESPSKCEVRYVCEVDEQFTEKGDPKTDETSSCLSRNENFVPYTCIAKEVARVNVGPQQDKVEKVVQGQEPIPFMNKVTELVAVLPDKMCGTSTISTEKGELSPCKMSLIDEMQTPEVLEKELVSRSPILVIDEKPHDFNFCSSTVSSVDVLSDGEDCQKLTGDSTPSTNEFPFKQKLQTSTGNTDPNHPCGLDSDVKIRTLRVLRSINEFLSATNHVDTSSQTETPDKKVSVETSVFSSKKSVAPCLESSHISGGSRNKKTNNKNMKSGSISTVQNLNRKPSDVPTSSVKIKFKNIPGVDRETPVDPDFYSYKTFVSEGLQEEQKTSQSNSSNDSHSYSQRPVMAVKPSKTEKSQTRWLSVHLDPKTTPQRKQASGHVAKHSSPTSMFLRETKQFFIEKSDALDSNHSICGPSSKTTWLANTTHSKTNKDEDKFALLNPPPQKKRNLPTLNQIPSSRLSSVQCSKSEESCPELRDGHSKFMEDTVNGTVENITEHITERGDSDESLTCDDNDALSEDGHIADPQTSIQCTVFNTGQKRSYSFLEQFSQRCLQNDITRASMEQECLIFLEKMKNLMKKSQREPLYQLNTYDRSMSCTSPLTVSFSSIEEEDDSVEILDTPLLRHKIKVDMSNSKDQTASKEEGKVLHSVSQERNNPMEHAGISTMTAECARLYNAKMHDVCSAKKVPPRLKTKKGHEGDSRTETSKHFDFCGQMKKELDETFRSNLNAVVKKSCKTKYRFYILVTSDEVSFEETKAQLEAEGHTAVQPSEFFLGEDSSSSLLIILRNEDIAEHICKIPDLLKLKMTPGVLFAGIDEPDDVLNLTHQELFTRAGFVMFDRAVLEPLSICNMKKISKNLEELSRMGKWKWMLHYRDSRRLKENARLSEEANQKKLFVYWCQDAGILEVLPYHECDQMTRDQPDYLECLLRLQVQHISSRFPVFITDTTTDSAFEKNGIFTMTLNTFLTKSPTEIFSLTEKPRLMSTL
ncbi:uncharacterized protein tasor2 isoform X2 [Girardinichthys multiradiatus]|uniref:uncharacterized protein tasor2 isoform X2 n=1 Tax=Girardinichthys multiradiatus TaxID=208333 RepID=UPI001FAD9DF2|nr:uncharacterized protein tasor2 isoform X2 [Girardinichthys multiradiatus]